LRCHLLSIIDFFQSFINFQENLYSFSDSIFTHCFIHFFLFIWFFFHVIILAFSCSLMFHIISFILGYHLSRFINSDLSFKFL
jgi:hypothetical protein